MLKKSLAVTLCLTMVLSMFTVLSGFSLFGKTITVAFCGSAVNDDRAVINAVNDRLKELGYNFKIKAVWDDWQMAATTQRLTTGDRNYDLVFTCSWTADVFTRFSMDGIFRRLDDPADDLLAQYGAEVKAAVPANLWDAFTLSGPAGTGIYGIPGYKDFAQMYSWDVNNTMMNELGMDVSDYEWNNASFLEPWFEEALAAAKAAKGDTFYPLSIENTSVPQYINSELDPTNMGLMTIKFDPTNPALPEKQQAVFCFDDPDWQAAVAKLQEFNAKGYIDPRLSIQLEQADALTDIRNNAKYLIGSQTYAFGYDKQASATRGIDSQWPPMSSAIVSTGSAQGAGFAISTYSRNPKEAMQFANLLYTDSAIATLLAYGVEGTHYEKNDDGTINTLAPYNDGEFRPWTNGVGNIFILPPMKDNGPAYYEEYKAYNDAGVNVSAIGFIFDQTAVADEIAALTPISTEYMTTILTGAADDALIATARERLEAAGIMKVVEEFNSQLDAFYAAQ
jgi:putative aldouronate transport system substrate-binding protein